MAATTYSPNAVALEASKATGRTITAKMVRTLVRATMPAYSKATHPDYQSHHYTAAQRTAIVAAFAARSERRAAQDAPSGKRSAKAKATTATRKAARAAKAAPAATTTV